MLKRRLLGETGDTIVEVMIMLAVLGLAIGISYATANRSLLNARQAQENSQASELVQSQVEQLRTLSDADCTTLSVDTAHCIYGTFGTAGHAFCLVNGQVTGVADTGCSQTGEAGRYSLSISRQDTSSTFTVVAQWPDVLGEGTDTVTMSYQLPPPVSPASSSPPTSPPPASPSPAQPQEVLTIPPAPRSTTYGVLCDLRDNRGSKVFYYSLTGESCAGGGNFDYNSTGDLNLYNTACQFPDGRYAYLPVTASIYCPKGSTLK